MSTILTAAIVILSTIGITMFFIAVNKRNHNKRTKALLTFFNQSGTDTGLAFSSQEVLKNMIIGLDGLHQTLSIFKFLDSDKVMHLQLATVKSCTLKKEYETIYFGNEKTRNTEQHLRSINLEFTFKKDRDPVSISFYDSKVDTIYEMAELEAKTKNWEAILRKIISKEEKREPVSTR
jgi:hypothetical protein